jgi:hypothetical protein
MTVVWNTVAYSFKGAYCLHHQGALMIEAVNTSETSFSFYESTRCNIPEDRHLHTRRRYSLKSYVQYIVNEGLPHDIILSQMNPVYNTFYCNYKDDTKHSTYLFQTTIHKDGWQDYFLNLHSREKNICTEIIYQLSNSIEQSLWKYSIPLSRQELPSLLLIPMVY